jgi:hypothetical protein
MPTNRREAWGPVAGLAFVLLFVVGLSLIDLPSGDDSAQKIANFYNDGGERAQIIIAGYLLAFAALFFFWFLGSLRVRLLAAEGETARLTSIVFGAGIAFATLLLAMAATIMTVAADITFGDEKFVSPEAARLLPELGYPLLLISGMFAAIAMIDAASVLIVRTGVLPTWVGWFGFAAAVILLFSPAFFPMLALLLWVLFVSATMYRRV